MKVLIVGGGGREHALANALARSPQRPQLLAHLTRTRFLRGRFREAASDGELALQPARWPSARSPGCAARMLC